MGSGRHGSARARCKRSLLVDAGLEFPWRLERADQLACAYRLRIPRDIVGVTHWLGIAFRKQADIDAMIRGEFSHWPKDPQMRRAFEAVCEALFPAEGSDARVPMARRLRHAIEVAARVRPSVYEQWGTRSDRPATA